MRRILFTYLLLLTIFPVYSQNRNEEVYYVRNRRIEAWVFRGEGNERISLGLQLLGNEIVSLDNKGSLELVDENNNEYKLSGPFEGSVLALIKTSEIKGNKKAFESFLSKKKGGENRIVDIYNGIPEDTISLGISVIPVDLDIESGASINKKRAYKVVLSNATDDILFVEVVLDILANEGNKDSNKFFSLVTKTHDGKFDLGNRRDWLFLNPRQNKLEDNYLRFSMDEGSEGFKLSLVVSDTPILFDGTELIVCKRDSNRKAKLARRTIYVKQE